MRKTGAMRLVELRHRRKPIEKILAEARADHANTQEAATSLGISSNTFLAWERLVAAATSADTGGTEG